MLAPKLQNARIILQVELNDNAPDAVEMEYVGPYYNAGPAEIGAYKVTRSTDPKVNTSKLIPVGVLSIEPYASKHREISTYPENVEKL